MGRDNNSRGSQGRGGGGRGDRSQGRQGRFNRSRFNNNKKTKTTTQIEYKFTPHTTSKTRRATFSTVKDHLVNKIQRDFKGGKDIADSLIAMQRVDLSQYMPIMQTSTKKDDTARANEQKQFDMIYRAKIEKFIERETDLEQGMPKAYSLIYSTYCTTTMQTRIEEHKDYESTIKNDPIKLLEAIQVLMQNPMRARYPFATMTDAFTKVLNYRQLEGQDLTDFYKERKDAFSVLKTMLGDRFLDGFVERTVEYQELTTDPEKDAMKKEAYEQWCAFLILRNSNQAKYGEVLRDLASQYSLDNDQYPRKTTKAVDCLSNHRHDNAGKQGKNGRGKD
jgi:hypothetical protein